MRVTSIHHMYPGTKIYRAILSNYMTHGFVADFVVTGWPHDHMLWSGAVLTGRFTVKKYCGLDGAIYLSDCGIPSATYNRSATFTTHKAASDYLAGVM